MATVRLVLMTAALGVVGLGITPRDATAQKRQRDLITRDELENSAQKDQDLYQAVRSLRPHFLAPPRGNRTMGAYTPEPAVLYINGTRQGDLGALKTIPTANVEEVRYYEPSKAQEEFGFTHSGGAVLVKLRQPPRPGAQPPPVPARPDTIPTMEWNRA